MPKRAAKRSSTVSPSNLETVEDTDTAMPRQRNTAFDNADEIVSRVFRTKSIEPASLDVRPGDDEHDLEIRREIAYYHELVRLGGRPLYPVEHIPLVMRNPEEHQRWRLLCGPYDNPDPRAMAGQVDWWEAFETFQYFVRDIPIEENANFELWKQQVYYSHKMEDSPIEYQDWIGKMGANQKTDIDQVEVEGEWLDIWQGRVELARQERQAYVDTFAPQGFQQYAEDAAKILGSSRMLKPNLRLQFNEDPQKQDQLTTWLEYIVWQTVRSELIPEMLIFPGYMRWCFEQIPLIEAEMGAVAAAAAAADRASSPGTEAGPAPDLEAESMAYLPLHESGTDCDTPPSPEAESQAGSSSPSESDSSSPDDSDSGEESSEESSGEQSDIGIEEEDSSGSSREPSLTGSGSSSSTDPNPLPDYESDEEVWDEWSRKEDHNRRKRKRRRDEDENDDENDYKDESEDEDGDEDNDDEDNDDEDDDDEDDDEDENLRRESRMDRNIRLFKKRKRLSPIPEETEPPPLQGIRRSSRVAQAREKRGKAAAGAKTPSVGFTTPVLEPRHGSSVKKTAKKDHNTKGR